MADAPNQSPVSTGQVPGARRLLVLLILLNVFNYTDRYVLPPVFQPIQDEFGVSSAAMGTLVTAFLVVYMLTAPLFGWLADRYSRWTLVGIGILIQAMATGGSGLAVGFSMLLIMRCIVGIGDATYGPAAPTLIADMFPIEKRGRMLAWFYAAIPVGSAIGFAVGGLMHHLTDSWRMGFYVIFPPMVLLGIICFTRKDIRHTHTAAAAVPRAKLSDYVALLKNRSFVLNCAGMTALTFAIGGIAAWMPTYLEVDRGLTGAQVALGFSAIVVVAGLIATLAGGWVGDLLRPRVRGSYFLVSSGGMLMAFPLTLLMLITPFPYAWIIIFAAIFCLFFNTGPSNTILANVSLPKVRSSAFALNIFVIHTLGDAISPPIIGWTRDHFDNRLGPGFALVSMMILAGGLFWLWGARYLDDDTRKVEEAVEPRGFEVLPLPARDTTAPAK